MTITITRHTDFQTNVPDDCDDLKEAVIAAKFEANHSSEILHEQVTVAASACEYVESTQTD